MNVIEKAIAESKARQAKATPVVAWYPHQEDGTIRGPHNRWFHIDQNFAYRSGGRIVRADPGDDVEWAAACLNNEPRFRDALEVAVKGLSCDCMAISTFGDAGPCDACGRKKEIERILEGK